MCFMMKWSSEEMKFLFTSTSHDPGNHVPTVKQRFIYQLWLANITWIKRMLNGNLHSPKRAMKNGKFSQKEKKVGIHLVLHEGSDPRHWGSAFPCCTTELYYRELDGTLSRWSQMWCIRKHEIQRSGVWLLKKNSNFIVVPSSWRNAGFRVIFELSAWICRLRSRPIFFPAVNENFSCVLLKRDPLPRMWPKSSWIKILLFSWRNLFYLNKIFVYDVHIVYFKLLN